MYEPLVYILILNFNRWRDTLECIESLKKINYNKFRILVVDNSSTDDSFNIFKKVTDIELVKTESNLGYTGGVNFGIRLLEKKSPDYILILNNDTIVTSNFLRILVNALERNSKAAAACGTILCDHDREKIWYASGKLVPWRGLAVHFNKGKNFNLSKRYRVSKTSFVTGCMLLLRGSFINQIGLEDERFFMYLDDIEYSARILKKGYELLYVPDAIIYHKVLDETVSPFKLYYSARNRLLLISTAFNNFSGLIAKFYFLSVIYSKLVFWKFTKPAFFQAAKMGIKDYFKKNFYKGNGFLFLVSERE